MENQSGNKSSTSSAKRKEVPHNEEDIRQDALLQPLHKSPKMTTNTPNQDQEEKISIGTLPKINQDKPDISKVKEQTSDQDPIATDSSIKSQNDPSSNKEEPPKIYTNLDFFIQSAKLSEGDEPKDPKIERSKTPLKVSDVKPEAENTTDTKVSKEDNPDPPAVKKKMIPIKTNKTTKTLTDSSSTPKRGRESTASKELRSSSKGSGRAKNSAETSEKQDKNEVPVKKETKNNGRRRSSTRNKSAEPSKKLSKSTSKTRNKKDEEDNDQDQDSTDEDWDEVDEDINLFHASKPRKTKTSAKKPAKHRRVFKNVLQIKITLDDVNPPIWRRIEVPENYNFAELHRAIQDSMGWMGNHMHAFRLTGTTEDSEISIGPPSFKLSEPENYQVEDAVKVKKYLKKEGDFCTYEYDFGDSWNHIVELEKNKPKEKGANFPRCTDGKRACPPEDCGGAPGYDELLKILKNKRHGEYQQMKAWTERVVGRTFRPEKFNPNEVHFTDAPQRRIWMWVKDDK
jgi:hypothetical protein